MEEKSFHEFLRERAEELEAERKAKRPGMLAQAVGTYRSEASRYPETIRVSFEDGHTEIYEIRVPQPAPLIEENIRIIRRMVGYQWKPPRRRRK